MPRIVPGPDVVRLVTQSQIALGLSQEKLGRLLTASRRTISRWVSRRSSPSLAQLQLLARAVYPADAALAAALAAETGQTLESLGVVRPAPAMPATPATPAPPAPRPYPPTRLVVESVVCAAAETMQATPTAVREVLRAAFARAQALGLSVEEMNEALSPATETAPAKVVPRGKRPTGS
jgi:transcriptional regulator with XRE-family HTH domain